MNLAILHEGRPMTDNMPGGSEVDAPRRPRILLVDDHDMGRRSLARLLDALGYDITAMKDGESAIQAMERDRSFDFVLTDLRLPDLDGREVVQAARRLLTEARIALITGWDFEPEESSKLGIDWVFLKPLDVHSIVAALRQCPAPKFTLDGE